MFRPEPLDPEKNNDEFFADAQRGIKQVVGRGQFVYWRRCAIAVFETGKESDGAIKRIPRSDGQTLLQRGVSLIFEKGDWKTVE